MSRRYALMVLLACCISRHAAAQSILTVAGGGPIGDGRPATEALLNDPWDTAIDAAGNLYISDTKNQRVRRVDAKTGIITTVAGGGSSGRGDGGPATEAELLDPAGLAIDAEGNLYIGSGSPGGISQSNVSDKIRRVSPDGIITTYADATFVFGMAVDREGNLHFPSENTIRKIDRRTGAITIVAGTGRFGFSGDGGPATAAEIGGVNDLTFDREGNLFIVDGSRIRRIDASTGIITTVAGNGVPCCGFRRFVPGTPALEAFIEGPTSIAVDAAGNLYLSGGIYVDARTGLAHFIGYVGVPGDRFAAIEARGGLSFDREGNLLAIGGGFFEPHRVDRLSAGSLTTIAEPAITIAGGRRSPDSSLALAANLNGPYDVITAPNGDLLFTDSVLIKKLEASSGRVIKIAGSGRVPINYEGLPALEAAFPPPLGIARDSSGNLFFSTTSLVLLKIDAATNIVTKVAGFPPSTGPPRPLGDGGPAIEAPLNRPLGLAVHPTNDAILITERDGHRIRRIDAETGIITTFAGTGSTVPGPGNGSFGGDGGPATSAQLNTPTDIAFDDAGNLYIADARNRRIRRVDAVTGTITTVAGSGQTGPAEGPALQVDLPDLMGIDSDATGNLWFTLATGAVRRLDARSGRVSIVAGTGRPGFTGDNGPARAATLNLTIGVAVDDRGNVFIVDSSNNRIRAVFACVPVAAPALLSPAAGATGVDTSPTLMWEKVDGAFRYDVLVAEEDESFQLVGSDVTATSLTVSNLTPGARYRWRVVAKGDPFCNPQSTATSETRSFTTTPGCSAPPPFALNAPDDNASNVSTPLQLTWSAAAGAGSYDVLLGTSNPPPVVASTPNTTHTAQDLAAGTTYYWSIIAHAVCDSSKTRATNTRLFRTDGACPTPTAFTQRAPRDGAVDVSATATLEWSPSANSTSYDLYFGTANPPPIFLPDLTTTTVNVSSLTPGGTYFWRVVAKTACDASRLASTPVARFIIRSACVSPSRVSFRFTPPGVVALGQTYVVAWSEAADLQPGGFYVVERSASASFNNIIDSQETATTSASFIAPATGTFFHRVTPVNPCSTGVGLFAQSNALTVVSSPPNVVFTVQPEAVITTLGQNLEDKRGRFVIENIGTDTISVIVGRQEIDSPPFFTIVDPEGGDSTFITLDPRVPKEMELRFSGPPNDSPASYQGILFLAALGKGLAITPYAFVSLRVGGADAISPEFRRDGLPTEYTFFPGFTGDDRNRPPITIDVRNSGSTPMELGAEIGPEVWLLPESGWNSTAIPPGVSRSVKLFTRRSRAPHGSALPRYTYFTVRTKSGASARLLVQDNDVPPTSAGRGSALDPAIRSLILPEISSATLPEGRRVFTTIRLSNLGSEPVNTELFFTPAEADGFDATRVKRATIAVPPNDVVTLTDPLVQLWALPQPARGQVEIRAAEEKIGLLAVTASVSQTAIEGGTFSYTIPTLARGDGARTGVPHTIAGISTTDTTVASLILAETSGIDAVSVLATLFDSDGNSRGERTIELARYSMTEISDLAATLAAGTTLEGARLDLTVTAGGGSAIGVVKILDRTNGGGPTLLSRNSETTTSANLRATEHRLQPVPSLARPGGALLRALWRRLRNDQTAPTRTFLLPAVFSGPSGGAQLQTTLGLYAVREATTFNLTYREGDSTRTASVTVPARRTVQYGNALQQLFGLTASEGSLLIETTGVADVYARLTSANAGVSRVTVSQTLPVISGDSEFVTTPDSQRPLYLDGLEQSIDPTRGTNWSLILNEITGRAATVVVRIYEAGNRSAPIAQKEFSLGALQRLKLPSVFGALDLDSLTRRKDRTNMLMSVVYKSGAGAATAIAMSLDNRTGDSKSYVLGPPNASSPFSVQRTTMSVPTATPRRRGVRH